jgi:ATP-binding cassette subfamily F protein 2
MGWKEKQERKAEFALDKELDAAYGKVDEEANAALDARDAAMGKGEEELFEKKLSKEEKKALAKAKRDAKKKAKGGTKKERSEEESVGEEKPKKPKAEEYAGMSVRERKRAEALDKLSADHIQITYESTSAKLHANTRDIKVGGVSLTFHGKPLLEETEININYGNRYGLIGPNGSGKVSSASGKSFLSYNGLDLTLALLSLDSQL